MFFKNLKVMMMLLLENSMQPSLYRTILEDLRKERNKQLNRILLARQVHLKMLLHCMQVFVPCMILVLR